MIKNLALAALLTVAVPAGTALAGSGVVKQYIRISSASIVPGATFSAGLTLTGDALKEEPKGSGELWLQLPPVSTSESKNTTLILRGDELSPAEMTLSLTVKGSFADPMAFPARAYLRYGGDGEHWSTWQPLYQVAASSAAQAGRFRYFQADLSVPDVDKARSKIGSFQVRLEGPARPDAPSVLTSALVYAEWDDEKPLPPIKHLR